MSAPQPSPYPHSPQASPPPGPPAAAPGSPLGRVAFIVALVVVGANILVTLVQPIVLRATGFTAFGAWTLGTRLVLLLGAAAALVLGLIALRRPGTKVLPGIAVGVGGAAVAGILFSWASSLLYSFI